MIFDRRTGLWKESADKLEQAAEQILRCAQNDTEANGQDIPERDRSELQNGFFAGAQNDMEESTQNSSIKPPDISGKCVLTIQFRNHGEYLKWKTYTGGRQWEFLVSYPANMRAEYEFHNSMEVEMMARKIVQLLQMGFNVYSAQWKLEEKEQNNETVSDDADDINHNPGNSSFRAL